MLGLAVSAWPCGADRCWRTWSAGGGTGALAGLGPRLLRVGWVIQFIGHCYEGRKPAFVDDLVGLLVGPMFVTAEALFALGWGKPLLAEIERRAGPTVLRDLAADRGARLRLATPARGARGSGSASKRSKPAVADEVAVGGAAEQGQPSCCAISWPICVMPLRETMIGTPICADFMTISLVSRPVV